ncbi:hypothetical protein [Amycolatopsis sp.]|uniref:hypothetical protein n=1 Tax=Amycolatopsis sp. TaxID=37632 RepID=UPI002BA61FB0|nr:hypothetical protein [Amycolatopsis sp.]HVV13000.1 hypothetical protein [Amycolatopsis sp.]
MTEPADIVDEDVLAPVEDVLEQRREISPDPPVEPDSEASTEADPADVADQRRVVVYDEDEPR